MSKPLIYLSGPMTGLPDFNYPAFNRAAQEIRDRGYPVFNPTETFGGCQNLPRETYLAVDLAAVEVCDILVLLPKWEGSEGALLEVQRAKEKGVEIMTLWDFMGTHLGASHG